MELDNENINEVTIEINEPIIEPIVIEAVYPRGERGFSVLSGAGAPTTQGVNGDTYLNTINGDTYIKSGGTWSINGNIRGPKGDKPLINTTSTTSNVIATGSKTFTLSSLIDLVIGQIAKAYSLADPSNYMTGFITAISPTSITINVSEIGGSGTKTDWVISISGFSGSNGTAIIPIWTATSFVSGALVSHLGKYWRSNTGTISTDVPGTSSKWIEDLSAYNNVKQTIGNSTTDVISQSILSSFMSRMVFNYNASYVFKGFCVASQAAPASPSIGDVYYYIGTTTAATVFGVAIVSPSSFLIYSGTTWEKFTSLFNSELLIPATSGIYSGTLANTSIGVGENLTFSAGIGFISSTTRVAFRNIVPIATYLPKVVLTVAAGYKAGVIFFGANNFRVTDFIQGFSSYSEGTSTWEYLGTSNVGYATLVIAKVGDSNISIAEATSAVTSFQMTKRDNDETKSLLSFIKTYGSDISLSINRSAWSGVLTTASIGNGEALFYQPGVGFLPSTTRVAFRNIVPIANISPKVVLTVAAGYKAGVIFWIDKSWTDLSFIQGFNWTEGTSTWEYLGNKSAMYVTLLVSKVGDSNISIAEATSAVTSFQMTKRDNDVTNRSLVQTQVNAENILKLQEQNPIGFGYSGERIDISAGHKLNYSFLFNLSSTGDFTPIGSNSNQGMAIYGDYMIMCYDTGILAIVQISTKLLINIITLPNSGVNNHVNSAKFSTVFPPGNTTFPYLYISECYGSHRCFVYSLTTSAATLEQTLSFTGTGYESSNAFDWTPDFQLGFIYTFGNKTNGSDPENEIIIKKFLLPIPSSGDKTFGNVDVIDSFTNNYIKTYQGNKIINNKLICTHGSGPSPSGLVVIDLVTNVIVSNVLTGAIIGIEPEDCDVYNGFLYVSFQGNKGMIYSFNF